mmetsp:Transcript_4110/g.10313  ORF Transcript_4110/g.10313 Transcript_4110/m.10313 type:complete len:263 (-) Transcript_4110:619-1407(-)
MGMGIIIIMVSVGPPFWRLKRGSTRLRPVSMRSGSRRRPRTSFLRGSVPPIPNSREYRAARWFSLRQRAGSPAEARGLELGERKLFKVDERARLLGLEARVREEVDEEGVLEGHLLLGAEHAHIEEVVHLVGVGLRVPLGEGLVHDAALGTRAVSLEDHGGGGRVVEDHGPATPENLAPRVVPVGRVSRVVDVGDGAVFKLDDDHGRVVHARATQLVEVGAHAGEDCGGHHFSVPGEPEQLVKVMHGEIVEQLAPALLEELE